MAEFNNYIQPDKILVRNIPVTASSLRVTGDAVFEGDITFSGSIEVTASNAVSASYALVAGKLEGTSGSTTVPVWINNGVPTPITSYSGTASFAVSSSISADSDKLGGKAANQYASSSHTHSVSDVTGLSSISSSVASLVGKSGSYESSASLASAASSWITANSASINSATASSHSHSNKAVLDGISAAATASWNSAATASHTHSNKAVLDGITSAMTASWSSSSAVVNASSSVWSGKQDAIGDLGTIRGQAASGSVAHSWVTSNSSSINSATASSHSHSNKAVLDGITAANTASWKSTATVVSTSSSIWSGKQDAITDIGTIRTQAASGSNAYTWVTGNSSSINSATASAHTHSNKAYLDSISAVVISGSIDAAINNLVSLSGSTWSDKGVTGINVKSGSNYLTGDTVVTSTGTASIDLATKSKNAIDWICDKSGSIVTGSVDVTAISNAEIDTIWENN